MSKRTMAIARATGMIGATLALAVSVTFAALTSTATLSDNTVSSATADLTVWNGTAFVANATGFHVTNLVPGAGSGDLPFYLRNGGGAPMVVTAHVPTAPSATGFTGWENLKVVIKGDDASDEPVSTTMAALLAGQVQLPSQPLPANAQGSSSVAGTEGNYTINFDINPGSTIPGASTATVGSFDIVLTGTQVAPTPE